MGTPRYMAPEQVYGQEADARTDLFAAGAILFEMLAGRPAFPGRTAGRGALRDAPRAPAGSRRLGDRGGARPRGAPRAREGAGTIAMRPRT
jgi:serine/threonine protein kinase